MGDLYGKKKTEIKIVNVMCSGEIAADLAGHIVPLNEKTKAAYIICNKGNADLMEVKK